MKRKTKTAEKPSFTQINLSLPHSLGDSWVDIACNVVSSAIKVGVPSVPQPLPFITSTDPPFHLSFGVWCPTPLLPSFLRRSSLISTTKVYFDVIWCFVRYISSHREHFCRISFVFTTSSLPGWLRVAAIMESKNANMSCNFSAFNCTKKIS